MKNQAHAKNVIHPEAAGDRGQGERSSASPAREPFKQISVVDVRRLCRDLPPPALKVWLYHLSLSGPADVSYAKLGTVAAATGLHETTVKSSRNWLRVNGWFENVGHRSFGRVSLPVFRCVFPGPKAQFAPSVGSASRAQNAPSLGSRRLKKAPSVGSAKAQIAPAEVDLEPEVDKKPEVHAPRQFAFAAMQTRVLPITDPIEAERKKPTDLNAVGAAALWNEIRTSLQCRVNPHSFSTWFLPLQAESLAGDRLRVSVPRPMWVRRLQETYGGVLREALAEIKRPELVLEFVDRKSVAAKAP